MKRESTKKVSDIIEEYVREDNLEDGLLRARIFDAWDLLLASRFNASSIEDVARITSRKCFRDGTLICTITSSVVRSQLLFSKEALRAELNTLLQGEYVKKLVLS